MTAIVMPAPKPQFIDAAGNPLVGGLIYTFAAGTSTPKQTFSDAAGTVPQPNPIPLNALGEPMNAIYWTGTYKVELRDSLNNLVYTVDNFQTPLGASDFAGAAGAGLIGFDLLAAYPPSTVGRYLVDLNGPTGADNIGYNAGSVADELVAIDARFDTLREELTGNRTYYVRTDGNDGNSGTANTAGGAWLTMQHASDFIAKNIDLNGFNVTVQVADGTYTAGVNLIAPYVGLGLVYFTGNIGNPAVCIVNANAVGAFYAEGNARFDVRGFRVTNTAGDGVSAQSGAVITVGPMEYGPCAASQINVGGGGFILLGNDYKITTGTSTSHLHAGAPGLILGGVITATLTGTPNYTSYFAGAAQGAIVVKDVTFTGAATGPAYLAHKGGIIDAHPAFATLPGSTAGRQATGGVFKASQTTPFQIAPDLAANNSVRMQSYNVTTGLFRDRFVTESQPTGSGGGHAWAYVDGDDSFMSGRTHIGCATLVELANANDGTSFQPALAAFLSQTSLSAANFRRNGTDGALMNFYKGGAAAPQVGSITVTGAATAYNTSSDYRLKNYIGPIAGAWNRIKALKTADFEFKAYPGQLVHGFIAHELAETHPDAVTGKKDATEVVTDPETGESKVVPVHQAIDPSKIIGDLAAALQEALHRIEDLEAKITQP